jgi:hypothetical protein
MDAVDMAQWLLRNSGPCIRYRVLADILNEQDVGVIGRALRGVLASPEVLKWLERLEPAFGINNLHSGSPTAYENVMGKLVQLGLRAGLRDFDVKTLPFRTWLSEEVSTLPQKPHSEFLRTLVASFLAYGGYGQTGPVAQQMLQRLEALHKFARKPDFSSIFVDKADYSGIPEYGKIRRLVNPELYPNQQFMLPWLHDIRGMAHTPMIMSNRRLKRKADNIVAMTLTHEYQELPFSYGLAKYGDKYYVIGWAVRLPGFTQRPEGTEFAEMLLNLEMLARFPSVQRSKWFRNSMEYLEEFQTERGVYSFLRAWLPEKKVGYWVGGTRMMFDQRTRRRNALECESTFWILRIKRLAGLS